jgi:hypothetical protein
MRLRQQFWTNLRQSLGFERRPLALARPPARLGFENLEERRVLSGLSPVLSIDPGAAQTFWSQ